MGRSSELLERMKAGEFADVSTPGASLSRSQRILRQMQKDAAASGTPSVSSSISIKTPAVSGSGFGSGYMPSLKPASTASGGYMGYGVTAKAPDTPQTQDAAQDGWKGLGHYAGAAASKVIAPIANKLTEAGTALNNADTGRQYNAMLRAEKGQTYQVQSPGTYGTVQLPSVTAPYSADQAGDEARANFQYMTKKEKVTALTKSGEELGKYINSLNLTARRREAEAATRAKKAEQYEASISRTAESARYAADDAAIGQYGKGNIDLYHRPQYRYNDGAIATVESMSFYENGKEVLVPTIAFDKAGKAVKLTDEQAIDRYHQTGEYLGKFDTVADADNYAEQLHRAQDYYYNTKSVKTTPTESAEGRVIAARVTGKESYALGKVQGLTRASLNTVTAGEAVSGRKAAHEYLSSTQRTTIEKYAEAGDFQSVADYYHAILPDLQSAAQGEAEEKNEKFSEKHPALSMPTQLALGMAGAIPSLAETVAGNVRNAVTGEYRDIDSNSPAFAMTAGTSGGPSDSLYYAGWDHLRRTESFPALAGRRGRRWTNGDEYRTRGHGRQRGGNDGL